MQVNLFMIYEWTHNNSNRNIYTGSKFIKTKWPTTKKKDKWSKDSLIDGRYEPAQIIQVLEVISGCKNENVDTLADQFYENTINLFFGNSSNKEIS